MGGHWVVYKIKAGCVVERIKVWRSGTAQTTRARRVKGSSTLRKIEANLRAAVKRLARILNANFSGRDVFMKLGYDELPADAQAREAEISAFLRRLKRQMRRQGVKTVKWVSVDSEKNGESGAPARPHAHIVITGTALRFESGRWMCGDRTLEEIWGHGDVWAEPLRNMSDYTPLALYLVRQAGGGENRQKWHSSRNMEKPTIEEMVAVTDRELRAPAGAVVTEKVYDPERGINYVRYIAGTAQRTGRGQECAEETQRRRRRTAT